MSYCILPQSREVCFVIPNQIILKHIAVLRPINVLNRFIMLKTGYFSWIKPLISKGEINTPVDISRLLLLEKKRSYLFDKQFNNSLTIQLVKENAMFRMFCDGRQSLEVSAALYSLKKLFDFHMCIVTD